MSNNYGYGFGPGAGGMLFLIILILFLFPGWPYVGYNNQSQKQADGIKNNDKEVYKMTDVSKGGGYGYGGMGAAGMLFLIILILILFPGWPFIGYNN